MKQRITIRNYRPSDLEALVALINDADAHDKLERATTVEELAHEMGFPTASPETVCFLAWAGDRLVGYTDLYARKGDAQMDAECAIYCWGVVHPAWRRHGLGRRLLEAAHGRAREYLPEIEVRRGSRCERRCRKRPGEAEPLPGSLTRAPTGSVRRRRDD